MKFLASSAFYQNALITHLLVAFSCPLGDTSQIKVYEDSVELEISPFLSLLSLSPTPRFDKFLIIIHSLLNVPLAIC